MTRAIPSSFDYTERVALVTSVDRRPKGTSGRDMVVT
jgi:hypothetical protein